MTTTIGIDVARFGKDRTAIAIQTENYLHTIHTIPQADLVTQAERITNLATKHKDLKHINIDDTGVGGGLTDIMNRYLPGKVRAINYGAKPPKPYSNHYPDTATALWFNFRDLLNDEKIAINPNLPHLDELMKELTSQEWDFTRDGGKIKIKPKKSIKTQLGRSPDLADAVLLAFWPTPGVTAAHYDVQI